MRRPLLFLGLALFASLMSTKVLLAAPAASISSLAWLAGCWERAAGPTVSMEIWMPPAGGVMLGMSRTVKQGKTVETEFMEIREEGEKLVFTAWPSGQSKASFPLLEQGAQMVLFGNPSHDFPQKIGYEGTGAGVLSAWIEGTKGGKVRRVDFPMTRAECPGSDRR